MFNGKRVGVGIVVTAGVIFLTSLDGGFLARANVLPDSEGASAAEGDAPARVEPQEADPPDTEAGESESLALEGQRFKWASSVFEASCALCHDEDGRADSIDNPRANLADKAWHHGDTLVEIETTIREGVPDTEMKPGKNKYTADQIADLAKYVKLLSQNMHVAKMKLERKVATELTDAVVSQLPPAPTGKVREKENFIDEYIFGKMKADGVPHAPLSTDTEFMRRVYLDLWGRLPDADAVRKFVADTQADKRNKLIDVLLGLDYNDPEKPGFEGNEDADYRGPWLVQEPFLSKWTFFF